MWLIIIIFNHILHLEGNELTKECIPIIIKPIGLTGNSLMAIFLQTSILFLLKGKLSVAFHLRLALGKYHLFLEQQMFLGWILGKQISKYP